MSDEERRAFVVKAAERLRIKPTPRLIADAKGEEPFSGRDFMPLQDAATYYGVTERQVRVWLERGVVAGFRFRSAGLEYNGRRIRPRMYWMVRRHEELRRENEEVNLGEVAREVAAYWGHGVERLFSPPVSRRLLRSWARGRPVKDPRHRRCLLDLWNGERVFEANGREGQDGGLTRGCDEVDCT